MARPRRPEFHPRLAEFRRRAGLTQEQVADRIGITAEMVRRHERGISLPIELYRQRYSTLYQATPADLGLQPGSDRVSIVNRASPDDGIAALIQRAAGSPSSLAVRSMDGLDFSFPVRGRQGTQTVSISTAREIVSVSSAYRRAYRCASATALLAAATAHLSLVLSLRPTSQPSHTCRLLVRAVGESAALAAALLGTDLYRGAEASRFLALAQAAAKENDDTDLAAVVVASKAFLTSFHNGAPNLAVEFAETAVQVASDDRTSATTRGWVAAVCSEQLAVVGAERQSLSFLDSARAALDGPETELEWTGFGTFDLVKITAYEGGDLVRLGRHAEAIGLLDEALAGFDPSMRRHRCATLIDRAEAHLAAQDIDACCADAAAALTIATETEHQVSLDRVRRIAKAVAPTNAATARRLWTDVVSVTLPVEPERHSPEGYRG